METDALYSIIDARTDQKWVRNVEMLVERNDWDELWHLALRTPPIWTVRIVKHLNKVGWRPETDEQQAFFQELSQFVSACNEYDLPGPDVRAPITMQIGGRNEGIASARITADGEFVFVLDDKASTLEVVRISDASVVEHIRLDMIAGKQYVTLAFAISRNGESLAVLSYDSQKRLSSLHLYELSEGEVTSDKWMKLDLSDIGMQISRLAFDDDGATLALYSAPHLITIIDLASKAIICQFENPSTEALIADSPYNVAATAHRSDWIKYGRWAVGEPASRSLTMVDGGKLIVAKKGDEIVFLSQDGTLLENVVCLSGNYSVSQTGFALITLDFAKISLSDFRVTMGKKVIAHEIAYCNDPLALLAISDDSELLAVSMSHNDVVRLWHLPDGRLLGSLHGLAHQALVDFRFTSGGSIVAVTKRGLLQVWEADGNGNAWPWSRELVQITHQPVDSSSVEVLRQAQEMRRRGWLSVQESNLLDLALALMKNRLNLDIEIEWEGQLPGDIYDIEVD